MNLPLAAWDSNGEIPFFEVATAGGDGLATFSTRLAEQYRAAGAALVERRVAVRTIRSLVEELQIDPPDFLTINAEGSEEPVIRGISLEDWRPGVFVVAANWPHTAIPSHQGWEPVLLEHGYLLAASNGVNRFYLRDDLRYQRSRLELPVSVLDRFQRAEVVALEQQVARPGAGIDPLAKRRSAPARPLHRARPPPRRRPRRAASGGPAARGARSTADACRAEMHLLGTRLRCAPSGPGRDPADAPPLSPDRPARSRHDRLPPGPPAEAEPGVLSGAVRPS